MFVFDRSEGSAPRFTESILPLYHGALVKLRINPSGREFAISKGLLCAMSPVFSAMFQGEFLESKEQTATLEEMEGVISERSLEALIQWAYTRIVKFDVNDPVEHISASMELARLANKYDISYLEDPVAQYIKAILVQNPHPVPEDIDANTHSLTSDHIISAAVLHRHHPVRRLLAAASVRGYLQSRTSDFPVFIDSCPSYAIDLLWEVRETLNDLEAWWKPRLDFKDPITGKRTPFNGDDEYSY
ncbi:hypothetical protein N7513_010252 [Penicillium frequentans]|nr:hypothetical protein N7513_010252 [Penicillium glabrum]